MDSWDNKYGHGDHVRAANDANRPCKVRLIYSTRLSLGPVYKEKIDQRF